MSADAYGRFMGRYSEPLARMFVDLTGVAPGDRVLDVGSGPGALTAALVERLGSDAVAAIDPSLPFVEALRDRLPGVDVLHGAAEVLPFPDDTFDAALAQLVVQFMSDPVAGLAEMKRVAGPGAVVAASVWDHGTGRGPLSSFWDAVRAWEAGAGMPASGCLVRRAGVLVVMGLPRCLSEIGPAEDPTGWLFAVMRVVLRP